MDLKQYAMHPITEYLYKRDICQYRDKELKAIVLNHPHITRITNQQFKDGSFGRFHSMNTSDGSEFTTEKALRRLLNLGLDKNDSPVQEAVRYMHQFMNGERELRDRVEKKHDWKKLTRLFVTTWLLIIDEDDDTAKEEAKMWAQTVKAGFKNNSFNEADYLDAYDRHIKPLKGKSYWMIENFYMVSLMSKVLDEETKIKLIKHLLYYDRGIYYIYGNRLVDLSNKFNSLNCHRYLQAIELLVDYNIKLPELDRIIAWIKSHQLENGLWDLGKKANDKMVFPTSNDWRKSINRQLDHTVRISRIISKYEK